MISNILILIILIYLAIRLLELILLILRRFNLRQSLTQIKLPGSRADVFFQTAALKSEKMGSKLARLE
jgi:hypothetical protein